MEKTGRSVDIPLCFLTTHVFLLVNQLSPLLLSCHLLCLSLAPAIYPFFCLPLAYTLLCSVTFSSSPPSSFLSGLLPAQSEHSIPLRPSVTFYLQSSHQLWICCLKSLLGAHTNQCSLCTPLKCFLLKFLKVWADEIGVFILHHCTSPCLLHASDTASVAFRLWVQ